MVRMRRAAIFIDGANMFYAQRKLNWHFEYRKILEYFAKEYEIYNAFYYTGVKAPPESKDRAFLNALTAIGYTVRTKTIKTMVDQETGEETQKANLDIEIAIDMFNTVDKYDVAILLSGDGDFERAVELLRSRGKEIIAVATKGMIAHELRNAVDKFIDLADLRPYIEKVEDEPIHS